MANKDRDELFAEFASLTENQQNVLGNIAINLDAGHSVQTLQSLERRGLIVHRKERLGGRFPVTITRYAVPPYVHMAWCEWCSLRVAEIVVDGI